MSDRNKDKRGPGKPPLKNRELWLFAAWQEIQLELLKGARNISAAVRKVMKVDELGKAHRHLHFYDGSGVLLKTIDSPARLRKLLDSSPWPSS
jgi:hypothetical protein